MKKNKTLNELYSMSDIKTGKEMWTLFHGSEKMESAAMKTNSLF